MPNSCTLSRTTRRRIVRAAERVPFPLALVLWPVVVALEPVFVALQRWAEANTDGEYFCGVPVFRTKGVGVELLRPMRRLLDAACKLMDCDSPGELVVGLIVTLALGMGLYLATCLLAFLGQPGVLR